MNEFRISAVWKDNDGVITHYAVHSETSDSKFGKAKKMTKLDAIELVRENTVRVWVWSYNSGSWLAREEVVIVKDNGIEYLRSSPNLTDKDNLDSLIKGNSFI